MGKRFQKHFKGIRCWKKTSADADVKTDATDPKVGETPEVKVKTRSRRLSKEEVLMIKIQELEAHLTKTISELYVKLDHQTKMNAEVLSKYLVAPEDDKSNVKVAQADCDELQRIREVVAIQIQHELSKFDKRKEDVGVKKEYRADKGEVSAKAAGARGPHCEDEPKAPKANVSVRSTCTGPAIQIQHDIRKLDKGKEDVGVTMDNRADKGDVNIKAKADGERGPQSGDESKAPNATITLVSTCTGPDLPLAASEIVSPGENAEMTSEHTAIFHDVGIQTGISNTTNDAAENHDDSHEAGTPVMADTNMQLSDHRSTPPTPLSPRHSALIDNVLHKAITEVNAYDMKEVTTVNVASEAKYSPNKVWNLTPLEEYYRRVSLPKPVLSHTGESPYISPFTRPNGKSRLSKLSFTIPDVLSNTQQSRKSSKLTRLETTTPIVWTYEAVDEDEPTTPQVPHNEVISRCKSTSPVLWSNEVVDPDMDIPMPITLKAPIKKMEPVGTEVECFGKPVLESGILVYTSPELPPVEKSETGVIGVDFQAVVPFGPKQKHTDNAATTKHTMEPVITDVYNKACDSEVIKVQELRMLCRQLFFEERAHCANGSKSVFGRIKLSHLALMYIKAACQNVKAARENTLVRPLRQIEMFEGRALVRPLREICRQLLGIEGVTKPEINHKLDEYAGVNTGVGKVRNKDADVPASVRQAPDSVSPDQATSSSQHVELSVELIGQFGAVSANGRPKPFEPKWEDWTDNTVTSLVQFRNQIPEFDHAPKIDTPLPRLTVTVTLRDLMEKYKNSGLLFTESHAKFLCANLLRGLKFLHTQDLVHGSVTPRKITFNPSGYPTLIPNDGQLGPKFHPRIEFSSSEEITSGPITMATYIFQTGVLVYSVLYGRSPYQAASYREIKENLLNDCFTPEFASGTLSKDGRYFLRKCLRKDPDDRFKLLKCKKSLDKAVKWFSELKDEELANQDYPSPFKDLVLQNT